MAREDTWAPTEGATFAWMTADEAVGYKRAVLTMWLSSRQLACRRCSEPGLRIQDISRIHWSHHNQSGRRDTCLADHPASIMPMIRPLSKNCDISPYCLRK
ncbi:uncharacterized protein TNCV_1724251 [Trichonephila clavipes]|nr:uncharacterized protein TNCV_1724251 [Trichonephila clavipes]